MTGLVILGLAALAAAGFGVYRVRTEGRFSPTVAEVAPRPSRDPDPTAWSAIAAALPGEALGERATLVQFSSAFCAPCRTTRVVLADVAATEPGVRHVELDAELHLDLVRALDVRRTPTTLVLDSSGRELVRAGGAPRRDQVLSALPEEAPR
ncbi:thiol-disulfide isomerase/thioredoxin [Nocardioides thalensis]|uniref:Thiol-disulfide isomerase/thioredoxin n=1 Tax=Nocardioides thalensis TaxID=1914755 RepID=A0A853C792_9ACTN|nr:thiol-disulfide isomerase/thioredoxin [Nocardioides thalensis]